MNEFNINYQQECSESSDVNKIEILINKLKQNTSNLSENDWLEFSKK